MSEGYLKRRKGNSFRGSATVWERWTCSRLVHLFAGIALILTVSSCAPRVPLGEVVELQEGETVAITGTGLRIRLEDVGHGWYAGGGHFPIVSLTVDFEGSAEEYTIEDTLKLGEYTIEVSRVFEPEGLCSIVVTRS